MTWSDYSKAAYRRYGWHIASTAVAGAAERGNRGPLSAHPRESSLVPDGVFVLGEGCVRFEALPPPTQGEVERLLRVMRHRVLRLLEKRGALPAQGPDSRLG